MFVRRLVILGSVTCVESLWSRNAFVAPYAQVHLPSVQKFSVADDESCKRQSVTGPLYEMTNGPKVKLFTKNGCTLCDQVKDVGTYMTEL